MVEHLPLAFAVDLRVRSKSYPIDGAKLQGHEITEGVILDRNGVRVTAFEVDHGGEELPAYGYRIDFDGRSAALSGDTTFNENLIRHAAGVDLLIHEVTAASGSAAESAEQLKRSPPITPHPFRPARSSIGRNRSWRFTIICCFSAAPQQMI
jgi:ribonuclease Z